MGKYNTSGFNDVRQFYTIIADELAEANRLKRLELQAIYSKKYLNRDGMGVIIKIPKEELEDQA